MAGLAASGDERVAVRWLALGLAWTALALTLVSPSLATVVEGLPNDHYHAFADPMVFVLVGIGAAALVAGGGERPASAIAEHPTGRLVPVAGIGAIVAWAVPHQPPAVASDGGFPAAEAAATRIEQTVALVDPIRLQSLPVFKTAEAYGYPLVRDGRAVVRAKPATGAAIAGSNLVILCDSLFDQAIGRPCGGQAEDAAGGLGGLRHRIATGSRRPRARRSRSTWRRRASSARRNANAGAPNAGVRCAPRSGPGGRTRIAICAQ